MKFLIKHKYVILVIAVLGAGIVRHLTSSYSINNSNLENQNVISSEYSINLICPKTAKNGETITCDIYATGLGYGGVEAILEYDGVTPNKFTSEPNWEYSGINDGKLVAVSKIDVDGETKIGSLDLTVNDNLKNQKVININNGKIFKITDEMYETQTQTTIINNPSTNSNLKTLTISEGKLSPEFNENITEYEAVVDCESIEILATGNDKTNIDGTGNKALKYGENVFNIVVIAEAGNTKIYTIKITRIDNRNSNNYLKSLTISNVDIEFNKDVFVYNYSVENDIEEIQIDAEAEDSKAVIDGIGTKTLNVGENIFEINVTSEKETKQTYKIIITRKEKVEEQPTTPIEKSSNNNLKTINITGIKTEFNKDVLNYSFDVNYNLSQIEISAEAEDNKATINGIGKKSLKIGGNIFNLVVTAENGMSKTYKITITRKDKPIEKPNLSSNNNIKKILINNVDLSLISNQDIYMISVKNNVTTAKIEYVLEDSKANAILEGDNELIVGMNKFNIIVTAENGSKKTYQIFLERKEPEKNNITINEDIISEIKNSENEIVTVKVKKNEIPMQIEQSVVENLATAEKTIVYEVLNENDALLYSIKLNSNDIVTPESINIEMDFDSDISVEFNDKNVKYLNFKNNGVSNTNVTTKVFVGDKFKNGESLTLSQYDANNKTVSPVKTDIVVENGYVTFESTKLVTYILSTKTLTISSVKYRNLIIGLVVASTALICYLLGIAIFLKRKNLSSNNTL